MTKNEHRKFIGISNNIVHSLHRFLDTGVYFYAGSGSVTMKGIVKVLSFRTQSGPIKFVLDGKKNSTSQMKQKLNQCLS